MTCGPVGTIGPHECGLLFTFGWRLFSKKIWQPRLSSSILHRIGRPILINDWTATTAELVVSLLTIICAGGRWTRRPAAWTTDRSACQWIATWIRRRRRAWATAGGKLLSLVTRRRLQSIPSVRLMVCAPRVEMLIRRYSSEREKQLLRLWSNSEQNTM